MLILSSHAPFGQHYTNEQSSTTVNPPKTTGLPPSRPTAYTYCSCDGSIVAGVNTVNANTTMYTVCAAPPYPTIASRSIPSQNSSQWNHLVGAIESAIAPLLTGSGLHGADLRWTGIKTASRALNASTTTATIQVINATAPEQASSVTTINATGRTTSETVSPSDGISSSQTASSSTSIPSLVAAGRRGNEVETVWNLIGLVAAFAIL